MSRSDRIPALQVYYRSQPRGFRPSAPLCYATSAACNFPENAFPIRPGESASAGLQCLADDQRSFLKVVHAMKKAQRMRSAWLAAGMSCALVLWWLSVLPEVPAAQQG